LGALSGQCQTGESYKKYRKSNKTQFIQLLVCFCVFNSSKQ
jgi:hypothetical protein